MSGARAALTRAALALTAAALAAACDDAGHAGCEAAADIHPHVVRLEVELDLGAFDDPLALPGDARVVERITVRPDHAGDAVTLFGHDLHVRSASAGYRYDGETATFCPGPFAAGDDVTLELRHSPGRNDGGFAAPGWRSPLCAGLRRWSSDSGSRAPFVVGAFDEPFCAAQWLFVPQSATQEPPARVAPAAADAVRLTVHTPDDGWIVAGPGGLGDGARPVTRFAVDHPMPLYAFSFAASPSLGAVPLGASTRGVPVTALVRPAMRAQAERVLPAVVRALDWMDANVGPYPWGGELVPVDVPGFIGGMEHVGAPWVRLTGHERDDAQARAIAVHEAVHHWWGDAVRFADWQHLWLAESFTDWCTHYRILGDLDPAGQAARLAVYRGDAVDGTQPLPGAVQPPPALRPADDVPVVDTFQFGSRVFYNYGASFLEMLDRRLRRDFATTLEAVLGAWLRRAGGTATTTEAFRDFLAETTGAEAPWRALFDEWVYAGAPAPILTLSSFAWDGGAVTFHVARAGSTHALSNVEVEVRTADGATRGTFELATGVAEADVRVDGVAGTPTALVVDPEGFYVLGARADRAWSGPPVTPAPAAPQY